MNEKLKARKKINRKAVKKKIEKIN